MQECEVDNGETCGSCRGCLEQAVQNPDASRKLTDRSTAEL